MALDVKDVLARIAPAPWDEEPGHLTRVFSV